MSIRVRALSNDEAEGLARMARSRSLGAGLVRRAQIVQHAVQEGLSAPEIAARMGLYPCNNAAGAAHGAHAREDKAAPSDMSMPNA